LAWTPDGRLLYSGYVGNSQVIWSMNTDGSDLRQLTSNKSHESDSRVCVTADGRYAVFQSNRSGSVEIWRMNSHGSNLKQLTTGGRNTEPCLSPDGRWVIYTATRDGQTALWRISIDGGEPAQITDTACSLSQVSGDGHYIACMGYSPGRLFVIPFQGGQPIKSFEVPIVRRGRWTPDGKAILYPRSGQGLWRQSLNEEKPTPVRGFDELTMYRLAWSFDGKDLAYTSGPLWQEIILIENFK
jgi:TolB protein